MLRDVLAPLLTSPDLLCWDEFRLGQRFGVDGATWQRAGELVRKMGLEWEQAPHRVASLKHVIRDHRKRDPQFDAEVRTRIAAWPPAPAERSLRQRALVAELDPANYHEDRDADGTQLTRLRYPDDIAAEIRALRARPEKTMSLADVLRYLEHLLGAEVDNALANNLYAVLDDPHELRTLSGVERGVVHRAIAALLLTRAWTWAAENPDTLGRLIDLIEQAVPSDAIEASFDGRIAAGPDLAWAATAALSARAWKRGQPERWDRIVSFSLATGIPAIVKSIITAARGMRSELGETYFAIVETATLSAALGALGPRMEGDPASGQAIARWRERLARRTLTTSRKTVDLDLVALAERVERLWRARFERTFGKQLDFTGRRNVRRRFSFGLGGDVLNAAFGWALQPNDWTSNEDRLPMHVDLPEHRAVLRMLWDFTAWRLRGDPDEPLGPGDSLDRLDDFGLTVIRTIAASIPLGSVSESRVLWEPVLALGPRGEFAVEHLISCFFLRLFRDIDPVQFISNWEAMLAYVFAPTWLTGGKWWRGRQILRRLLGLDATSQIIEKPQVLAHVERLALYYERFAREHLASSDSEIAAYASFMASRAGEALRLSAICWIDDAIGDDSFKLKGNAAGALADLAQTLLAEHASDLIATPYLRRALNNVIARLVRDQAPYALALQDRARALR